MPLKIDSQKNSKAKSTARAKKKSVLNGLLSYDQSVIASYKHFDQVSIVGVDEVGIGCLAGPVVAAATILPTVPARSKLAKSLAKLNDSKKLNHETRKELSLLLHDHAYYSIASASVEEIDEINILQAGLLAMKRAVSDLMAKVFHISPNIIVLVDGNKKIPHHEIEQICIIQGDAQSASIAAASVIAKVFRDEWMQNLALEHPHYLWHSNKGYGSSAHRQAIAEHGLSIWHRRSFTKDLILPENFN
jgi:ribonuclease HII